MAYTCILEGLVDRVAVIVCVFNIDYRTKTAVECFRYTLTASSMKIYYSEVADKICRIIY